MTTTHPCQTTEPDHDIADEMTTYTSSQRTPTTNQHTDIPEDDDIYRGLDSQLRDGRTATISVGHRRTTSIKLTDDDTTHNYIAFNH